MSIQLSVTSKASHEQVSSVGNQVILHEASVVQLGASQQDIENIQKVDSNLVIVLRTGEVITIRGFFPEDGSQPNDLILTQGGEPELWLANFSGNGVFEGFTPVDSIEPLLAHESFDLSSLAWVAGGLLLGGAALGGGGSGGSSGGDTSRQQPDPAVPTAPKFEVVTNSDGSVTLLGVSDPGAKISITYPDGTNQVVLTGPDGRFAATSPANQPSGEISAVAIGPSGDVSDKVVIGYVDITAPEVPSGIITGNTDGSITVTGEAEPGSTVEVTFPDGSTGSVVVDESGSYELVSPPGVSQPEGEVTLVAVDKNGNSSGESSVEYVDSVAPTTTASIDSYTADTTAVPETLGSDTMTNDATPVLNGTLSDELNIGEILKVYRNGELVGAAEVQGTNWSFAESELQDASYAYTVCVADQAGNEGPVSNEFNLIIDLSAPSVVTTHLSISAIADDDIVSALEAAGIVTVRGTVEGDFRAGDKISVETVVGTYTGTVAADGSWSIDVPVDGMGGNGSQSVLVTLEASDAAGNVGNIVATRPYVVDIDPPQGTTLSIDVIAGDDIVNLEESLNATITVKGMVSGEFTVGDIVTVTVGEQSFTTAVLADGSWSVDVEGSLLVGGAPSTVMASLEAHNSVGNVAVVMTSRPYTVDVSLPGNGSTSLSFDSVTADNIINAVESANPITLTGRVSGDYQANDQVTLTINGNNYSGLVAADGTWSVANIPGSELVADANHLIEAVMVAHDNAGNSGLVTAEHSYVVQTSGVTAALSIDAVAADNIVNGSELQSGVTFSGTVTGTFREGDVVTLMVNGVDHTVAVDASGLWSIFLTGSELGTDGAYTAAASVVAHDEAGNTGTASAVRNYSIDTGSPGSSTTTLAIDTIAGDDQLNANESLQASHTISGTVSGDFKVGDKVTVTVGGQTFLTAVVAGTGAIGVWSVNVPGSVLSADSKVVASLEAHDAAGNIGTVVTLRPYIVDTLVPPAPTLQIIDDKGAVTGDVLMSGGITDDDTLVYRGTAEPGSIIHLSIDGAAAIAIQANGNGEWSYSAASLASGSHSVSVTQTDAAGNVSPAVDVNFIIDLAAVPPPTLVVYDDLDPLQSVVENGTTTNDMQPTFRGSGEIGAAIHLIINGVLVDGIIVGADGTWSYTPTALGVDGQYTISVSQTTLLGTSAEVTTQFFLDTSAPTVEDGYEVAITGYADDMASQEGDFGSGSSTNDTAPLLKGTVAGLTAGDVVRIYEGSTLVGMATIIGNSWSFQLNGVAEGSHTYRAVLADAAGNEGLASSDFTLVIDTSAPALVDGYDVEVTGYADDVSPQTGDFGSGSSTNDTSPLLKGTVEGLATGDVVRIYEGGTLLGMATVIGNSWSFQLNGIAEGSHTYRAVLADAAGNEGLASSDFILVIDTKAPALVDGYDVEITGYADDVSPQTGDFASGTSTNDTSPLLKGTVSGLTDGDIVRIYEGTQLLGLATVTGNAWSFQLNAVSEGGHTYRAVLADAAGNEGLASNGFTLQVDAEAPTQSVVITAYTDDQGLQIGDFSSGTATDDSAPVLKGTLSAALGDGDVVRIYDNGTYLGNAFVTGNSWIFTLNSLEHGSTHTFTAQVMDLAGNVGAQSNNFAMSIDQSAPTQIATIDSYTDDVGLSQGSFDGYTTTDDRAPVLNGTLSAALNDGEEVRIYEGSTLLGTATVAGTAWTFQISSALADGSTHTFTAKVADAAGNESAVSLPFTFTVDLVVIVDTQSTLDTTPIVTGHTGFTILPGEYLEVTINGKTYSSQTGQVVVDLRNSTWYVQIPESDALTAGVAYDVVAVLKDAQSSAITKDDTVGELVIGNAPVAPAVPASSDTNNKATGLTIGEDGVWRIFTNNTILDANGTNVTNLSSFSTTTLYGNAGNNGTVVFTDFDRDGDMDMVGEDSVYWDGQQAYENKGSGYTQTLGGGTNSGYYAFQIGNKGEAGVNYSGGGNSSAETYTYYGSTVVFDKVGDGYADILYGDPASVDWYAGAGYETGIVLNDRTQADGSYFHKDGTIVWGNQGAPAGAETGQTLAEKIASAVDLNNDGTVDLVYHSQEGSNHISGTTPTTGNYYRLVVMSNSGDGGLDVTQVVENALFWDDSANYDGQSMTWADFNGDGWLDLFTAMNSQGRTGADNNSQILFNDGTGRISANNTDADLIDESLNRVYDFSDNLEGGGSMAVDWNADGKVDIIEMPVFMANPGTTGVRNVLLHTNQTSSPSSVQFSQSTLLSVANKGVGSSITGALTLDMDWDGDRDAIFFTGNQGATFIENTTKVEEGTSLHLRILDQNGINALFGNTVQLFDSKGNLVATQILNPQSGNQTSDSSALVDFYGLNPSETYTAVLLRNIGGQSQDVSGVSVVGSNTIENINLGWTGLTVGKAHDAYVLTAEAGSAVNNANAGNGIIGTGYNDTFIATQGIDMFEGGGGTTEVSGSRQWSNTGGLDIVDYKLAGSTALVINLANTGAQNTGFGTVALKNIEGLAGGAGNDVFTDNTGNNYFEGRDGNDTYNLSGGGKDTLMYKLLNAGETGGNGIDVANDFWVGTYEATSNADRIDIKALLIGYADGGGASYINGTPTLAAGETIGQFLQVSTSGGNTTISIDRDGIDGAYSSSTLVTLQGVETDLATLLANHQLVVV